MQYKAILFDKDGTLIDFHRSWFPVYQHTAYKLAGEYPALAMDLLVKHGYDHDSERFLGGSLLAAGNNEDIAAAWSELLPVEVDSRDLNRIFQQQITQSAVAVPNLKQTIHRLQNFDIKLGIATNDSCTGIENSLRAFGILPCFDFLCGYDSGHGVKPDAGMVLAFCKSVSIAPGQTIVVGDNKHDIEMGRNAGAGLCVGVLTGASSRGELESLADVVYDDISGLLHLFS